MNSVALPSGLCLALLLGGCPKRQTNPTVVYVPSPPAAANTSASPESSGAMVVEQPTPPESQEKPSEAAAEDQVVQKQAARTHRRSASNEPAAAEAAPAGHPDQPAAPVPSLEPRETPQQQDELRHKVQDMEHSLQARIARLEQTKGRKLDPNTLEGARVFVAQSQRALDDGDLQRAFNLARKASLLVDGLEQKP